MPKYNLMDSQQPEFFNENLESMEPETDKPEPEINTAKPQEIKSRPAAPDSDFSEKLFTETDIPKKFTDRSTSSQIPVPPEPTVSAAVKTVPVPPPVVPKITTHIAADTAIKQPPKSPSGTTFGRDESTYEMTMPESNFKPLMFGIGIVAAILVIAFLVWKIFFSDKAEIPPPETAEQKLKRELLIRKNNVLTSINADTHSRLGYLVQLIDLKPAKVHYSSLYVYDENLACEVFTTSRTDLADLNSKLKNSASFSNLNLETVDKRPGSRGGFFALYDIKTAGGTPLASTRTDSVFISRSPQDWINDFTQKNSLTVDLQKQVSLRQEELFSIIRYEYKLKGPESNCQAVISELASANTNISIHKLTLLPTNQRDLTKAPYQLHLILDFYM
jgi:hypothetical protein